MHAVLQLVCMGISCSFERETQNDIDVVLQFRIMQEICPCIEVYFYCFTSRARDYIRNFAAVSCFVLGFCESYISDVAVYV